jgi:hypothetical protein
MLRQGAILEKNLYINRGMLTKAILLCLLLVACHKINGSNGPAYFPNAAGDYWIYNVTDSVASLPGNPFTPLHYSVKVVITGTTLMVDGKPATVWQYQYPWGNDTNFVRFNGDTVKFFSLVYSRSIANLAYPRVIFVLPLRVNSRWDGLLHNIDSSRVLTDSAGTYTIYHHYIGPNTEYNDYYFFTPNKGMALIRYNDYNNAPVHFRTWTLVNHHLQ